MQAMTAFCIVQWPMYPPVCCVLGCSLKEDIALGKSFGATVASSVPKALLNLFFFFNIAISEENVSVLLFLLCFACLCLRQGRWGHDSIYLSSFNATCHFFSDAFSRD